MIMACRHGWILTRKLKGQGARYKFPLSRAAGMHNRRKIPIAGLFLSLNTSGSGLEKSLTEE